MQQPHPDQQIAPQMQQAAPAPQMMQQAAPAPQMQQAAPAQQMVYPGAQ